MTHAPNATPAPPPGFRERSRRVLALALPIIGGMVSQNLLNLVDTAMVGRLGSAALAATGFGGMVNWLAFAFFIGMGSGVQAIAARRTGEGRGGAALGAVRAALAVTAVVVLPYGLALASQTERIYRLLSPDPAVVAAGAPYLALRLAAGAFTVSNFAFRGYWNGIGRSTVYLRTILVIHAVNIALNWLLIYGNLGFPRLGVTGAGLASAVAVLVGTATYVALAVAQARASGVPFLRGGLPPGAVRGVLRLSIPAGGQNLFMSAGYLLFYRVAQLLGTAQVAATAVLTNLALVCVLPALGFGLAAATLVGQSLGAGDPRGAARWAWHTVLLAVLAMVLLGGALAAAPRLWLDLLMDAPRAEAMALVPLVVLGLSQPLDAVGMVLSQALIGAGNVRPVMVASVLLQWGLFLPGAYLWGVRLGGGLLALWLGMGIWRAVYAGTMTLVFRRGGWARVRV